MLEGDVGMITTKELAKELKLSETAIRDRANRLGISPQEVAQGRGRPRQLWTDEQANQIRQGTAPTTEPDNEGWIENTDQAGHGAIVASQGVALQAAQTLLASLDHQCSNLEDQVASAAAARVAAIPARSMVKAAQLLQAQPIGLDFAGFAVPVTPYARQIAGDRFPESID